MITLDLARAHIRELHRVADESRRFAGKRTEARRRGWLARSR